MRGAIFVHGWMVTGRLWSALTPALPGHHVVAELRFQPTTTLDDLVDQVLEAARIADLARFDLVGHSMGGQIAQLVAARAPARVRSLALINPVPLSGLAFPPEAAAFFRTSGGNRAAQNGILDQACLALAPSAREALLADAGSIAPESIATAFDLFVKGGDVSALAAITAPTWVLATDDPFLPPPFLEAEIVSKIAGARLEVLPAVGHYPLLEATDETAARLRAFWEST